MTADLEFFNSPYLSLTAELFPDGSESLAFSGYCVHQTNRKGMYLMSGITVEGFHSCHIYQSGELIGISVANFIDGSIARASESFVTEDIYFANIKYVKDTTNLRDEYSAVWFQNTIPVTSGNLTNPAISVYNTNTGAALFVNQPMTYAGQLGIVRYNDSSFLTASGEPYLIYVSGTIGGGSRTWQQLVGLDLY